MGYSDQKFQTRVWVPVKLAFSLGTTTASGTAAIASGYTAPVLPQFDRRTQVNKVKMTVTTIPNAASTALKGSFLSGTNTFATVTLTTATAGQVLDGTMTLANAIHAADVAPTFVLEGTATASGSANGAYDIYFEQQELFAE